jgi:hypothetical protein
MINKGNTTEQHRLECEARHMLTLPLAQRRKELDLIEKLRGEYAVAYLKEEIIKQFRLKKTND